MPILTQGTDHKTRRSDHGVAGEGWESLDMVSRSLLADAGAGAGGGAGGESVVGADAMVN